MANVWDKLLDEVPSVFAKLQASEPLLKPTSSEHKRKRGIYAFRNNETIVHVGRTRNLQQRMQSHQTANHNSASLAFKLARNITGQYATYKPEGSRADLMKDEVFRQAFLASIAAIKKMDVLFVEVHSHELQYLVELYACLKFGLPTDEFDTS